MEASGNMYILFAMLFPPPHYGVSVFLMSIATMYLLWRYSTLRTAKRLFIAGLLLVGLIIFHFVWFWIDYLDRHVDALVDCAIHLIPAGLIGAVLGFCLGIFAHKKLHGTDENNNDVE